MRTLLNHNHVITVSKSAKDSLIECGFNPDHIKVIYNGVEKVGSNVVSDNTFTIAFIGSLNYEKGVDILINSLASLKEHIENRNVETLIIGQGDQEEILRSLATKLNVNCQFVGFQSYPFTFSKKINLLVVPSRIEAFGLVIIEAMSQKVPVIGANIGCINEIISDGYNGILFDAENQQKLEDKILYTMNNYSKVELMD